MKLPLEILQELLPNTKKHGSNLNGKCPYCGHDKFGISLSDNHVFNCYRKKKCGVTGNIYTLLKHLGRTDLIGTYGQAKKTIDAQQTLDFITEAPNIETSYQPLPSILLPVGFTRTYSHPYLQKRGFQQQDYEDYIVGTTPFDFRYRDYIIIVLQQQGCSVAFLGRNLCNDNRPKYRNSVTDFGRILGGYDEIEDHTEEIILVEGFFDKTNVTTQLNLRRNAVTKCLCSFGAHITDQQIALLKTKPNVKSIYLMYDPDVVHITKQTGALLIEQGYEVFIVTVQQSDKDPGELTAQEMHFNLNQTKTYVDFFIGHVPLLVND